MAFFELNVLSVGENGDTERIEIGSNYINMMDNSSNSLFLLNASNNVTSINTSLHFNVLPTININNTSSYLATTIYVDSNISQINTSLIQINDSISTLSNTTSVNASVSSLINDANASINIINASLIDIANSISILSNTTSVNASVSSLIDNANASINIINSSLLIINDSIINLSTIAYVNASVNEYVASLSNNAVDAVQMLNTFFAEPVANLTAYVTNISNVFDEVSSTSLIIGGTYGTSSQSYAGSLTSGTLSIGNYITTGNISIGSSNASNQVNVGGVLIGANAINAGSDSNFQIASTNSSGSISIGDGQTGGIINIGTNASRNASIIIGSATNTGGININSRGVIAIGADANASNGVTIGNSTGGTIATTINGFKMNFTGTEYNIEPSIITNTCNIFNTTAYNINIGNGQFGYTMNIGNRSNRTGLINIAAAQLVSITRISGLDIQGYKLNVCANTTTTPNPVPLVIGDSARTSGVIIGKSGANTSVQGTASIVGGLTVDTINSSASNSAMTIGSNNTSGSISIGANISTGGSITIGSNTPGIPATSINGIKFEYLSNTYRIEPTTISSACNIYNNTTGGIFMGNSQFSGQITIGNVATRTGTISIGAGSANQPTPAITRISGLDIQGYKLNVCANTTTTPNPVPLVIGDSAQTSAVTIGNSSNTTTINSGTINLARPPLLTYTTLPTFTSSQIGYTIRGYIAINTATAATNVSANPYSSTTFTLGVGVWMMNYQLRLRSATGTPTTTITKILTMGTLTTAQTDNVNYGLILNTQSYALTSSNYSITSSALITNNTPNNVLTPSFLFEYTPNSLMYDGADNYFSVTRIA
jgi:hypothetical protein